VIDLHSHLLPGVDDGARDLEETLGIARSMVADGITTVACTPHVRDDYPTTPDAMESGVVAVRAALAEAGIPLHVLPGGEVAIEKVAEFQRSDLERFGLGGNPRLLLLEFPYYGTPLALPRIVHEFGQEGIRVVIAHPERNADVQARPETLRGLVDSGAAIQLTAASVDGRLGRAAAACSLLLVEVGLAHLIASDAHAPGVRQAGVSAAAKAVGGGRMAGWLTHDVPAALLADRELPPRPALPRRGRLSRLRRL
jgi:protein-tyrosine phosphatase